MELTRPVFETNPEPTANSLQDHVESSKQRHERRNEVLHMTPCVVLFGTMLRTDCQQVQVLHHWFALLCCQQARRNTRTKPST
jgi:hypothetical protein